jgi:hypothetical protein
MKREKNPCEGCVWKLWTGSEKIVVCSMPKCMRDRQTEKKGTARGAKEKTVGH